MSAAVGGIRPSETTLALLEDIERRIDPEVEEDFKAQWRSFLYGGFAGEIFTPKRKKTVTSYGGLPFGSHQRRH